MQKRSAHGCSCTVLGHEKHARQKNTLRIRTAALEPQREKHAGVFSVVAERLGSFPRDAFSLARDPILFFASDGKARSFIGTPNLRKPPWTVGLLL